MSAQVSHLQLKEHEDVAEYFATLQENQNQSTMEDNEHIRKLIGLYFQKVFWEVYSFLLDDYESLTNFIQVLQRILAKDIDIESEYMFESKDKGEAYASEQKEDGINKHFANIYVILSRLTNDTQKMLSCVLHFFEMRSIRHGQFVSKVYASVKLLLENVRDLQEKVLHSYLRPVSWILRPRHIERRVDERLQLWKFPKCFISNSFLSGSCHGNIFRYSEGVRQIALSDFEGKDFVRNEYYDICLKINVDRPMSVVDTLAKFFVQPAKSPDRFKVPRLRKMAKDGDGSREDPKQLSDYLIFQDLHSSRAQLDSNEQPNSHLNERISRKSSFSTHAGVDDVTTHVGHTGMENTDAKDCHPVGVYLGQQSPLKKNKVFLHRGVRASFSTILSPDGEEIFDPPSTPPSPPPPPQLEDSMESSPADTCTSARELFPRFDSKFGERDYHEATETDEAFSKGNDTISKKSLVPCHDDITDEAEESYSCRKTPTEIVPTEVSSPMIPETTVDITGEQEGPIHQEERGAAEENFYSMSLQKMGLPLRNPSHDAPENSQKHFEAQAFGPPMTTLNEESPAVEPPESLAGEFHSVLELKCDGLNENALGDRRQTSENPNPELSQQSPTEETTPGVSFLFIKEGATVTIRLSSPEPDVQGNHEEDKYSIAELEILLGELARSSTTTNAHLTDRVPYQGSTVADEDYVSLAESKGPFPQQRSLTEIGQQSRLRSTVDPFRSVKARKVGESRGDLSNTRSENDRNSNQNSSDGRSFDYERQSAAESQTISTSETHCFEEELVGGDPSRETGRLELLRPAKTVLNPFHQLLSPWELLLRRLLSIMLRPLFPNLQNGFLRVDFRSPRREPMIVESFRLCTFLHCPSAEALSALRLANAGFYYTGRDGVVACYSCGLRCRHDDARLQRDPYAFHREMNRHCPHLNNMDQSHLFIQDHQTSAHSGRDITGSPSEGTGGEQGSVREMVATSRQAMGQALTQYQVRLGALSTVSTETSATGRAAVQHSEHEPQSSAADVSPHEATSASAGTESGSPRGPHSVSSLHSSSEGAENAPAASTNTITNTTSNNTARQDSPASQHPAVLAATIRTTSSQTASSAASHQVSNTSLLNSGGGQLATGGRDTGNSNRSASYATTERSSGDITSSPGDVTRENPRTGRSPQEDLESRQTSSRPVNATVPTGLTNGQRDYAPTRGNDEPSGGNDSRTFRPRMGLLGGSSAHGELREIPMYSAVNENPPAVNHTMQGGEAPPAPRQVEAVAPSDAVRPAPPLPAYDPSRAVHRQYADIETRVRSFLGRWPDTHAQSPEELAQAGFFYAGAEDCVRCHFCGLGLKHWDPDDRPLEEHMRWRSSCGFLRDLVGEEEIARTLARIGRRPNGSAGQPAAGRASARSPRGSVPNGNAPQMTSPGLRAEAERFMTSEVVIAAREMGFPDDSIRRGIEALLRTSAGRRAVTSQNLVHAILFLRERGRDLESPTPNNAYIVDVSSDESDDETAPLPPNDSQTNRRANALENVSGSGLVGHAVFPPNRDGMVYYAHTEQSGSDENVGQQARSHRSSPNSSSPSQSRQTPAHADASMNGQDGAQTIRQLEQENQELRERRRCKICLDNDVNILFMPCGHLVCCAECAPALRRCPICRRRISGTVSIQFAGLSSGQLQ